MVIWRIFSIFSDFFKKKNGDSLMFPTILTRFVHSSFDRLIIWSIWFIWSFDPFDPKIYAVSLFCLCIFFTYSFFLFFMFWFSEEEMEEVRDRFFFFIRSEDRRRQQNLGQNGFFFCHQAIFLAHTKIWEFQFILVRLFCLLLLLQKLGSGGSNWKKLKKRDIINIATFCDIHVLALPNTFLNFMSFVQTVEWLI